MAASKAAAACVLALLAGSGMAAQESSKPTPAAQPEAGQNPSQTQTKHATSSHPASHHVQVPAEDAPPPELTQAEAAIERQDYAGAETLLRKYVEKDSASYAAWFDLGFTENALGHLEESISAYRKSVAAKPDVFESNLNLGLQLAKTGQPEAETFLKAATQLKPTSHAAEGQYRAWLSLAETISKAKPEEALAAYQHAEALLPLKAEPHLAAGEILEEEKKFTEAEQEYKTALALDPHATDAVIGLANMYRRARRFPEAEENLRKLLADHSDSAPVHIELGRVLAAEGKNDDAAVELQAGLKLTPADENAQRDLAEVYTNAGKYDLAEKCERDLLRSHPNDADLHRQLGKVLLHEKKYPEAQQEFVAAIKSKPEVGETYGDLAFAAGENKNYDLAIRALDARAKLLPETPVTYFLRASAYDHLRDFKKASANYHLFLNTAAGKYPDQEWQARHRLIAIEPKK